MPPALPIAIPLLAAAALTAVGHFLPRPVPGLAAAVAAAGTTVCSAFVLADSRDGLIVHWVGGWQPRDGVALGISIAVDPFGAGLAVLAGILVTAAVLFALQGVEEVGVLFYALMLLFLGGMTGFAFSGDLFNLFVFFELMGVAAYALTGYQVAAREPIQGAINFAVTNSIGGFLLLLGIALLYGRTGALNLAQLGQSLAGRDATGLVVVAFALLATGFLVKSAIVPFHFWLADAYAVAPAPVCAVLAGAMSEIGIYGIARVYWTVFEGPLGSHEDGVRAVLVGAGLLKGGLFLTIGALRRHLGSIDELTLRGRGREVPGASAVFLAGALGLLGLPPLGIFLGHALLEEGGKSTGNGWLVPMLTAASVLASAAILRAWGRVFLGLGPDRDPLLSTEPEEDEPTDEARGLVLAPAAVLIAAGLFVSFVPPLASGAERAAHRFQDRGAYVQAVLSGRQERGPRPSAHPYTRSSLAYGLASSGAAIAVAALALRRRRNDGVGALAARPLHVLRAAHSGHIGDYVAWIVAGAAVLGGLLTLAVV